MPPRGRSVIMIEMILEQKLRGMLTPIRDDAQHDLNHELVAVTINNTKSRGKYKALKSI